VRAEVIGRRAAARMMDDQTDVDGGRLARPLPGFAEPSRLVVSRQRFGFADVNLGRLEAQAVSTIESKTLTPGTIISRTARPSRSAAAITAENKACSSSVAMRVRRWIVRDNPPRRAGPSSRQRRDRPRRVSRRRGGRGLCGRRNRHEEIARPHVSLPQIHDVGRSRWNPRRRRAGPRVARPLSARTQQSGRDRGTHTGRRESADPPRQPALRRNRQKARPRRRAQAAIPGRRP
jgi:hypothetical protein